MRMLFLMAVFLGRISQAGMFELATSRFMVAQRLTFAQAVALAQHNKVSDWIACVGVGDFSQTVSVRISSGIDPVLGQGVGIVWGSTSYQVVQFQNDIGFTGRAGSWGIIRSLPNTWFVQFHRPNGSSCYAWWDQDSNTKPLSIFRR